MTMKHARVLVLIGATAGCREAPQRSDARAIVRAYEEFQNASHTDREAAIRALASTACTDAPACRDRDTCVKYAQILHRAQGLARKARELGPADAGGSGAATAEELAIIVSAADDATKQAATEEPACRAALERLYSRGR